MVKDQFGKEFDVLSMKYVLSCFLDDENQADIEIFIVREWIRDGQDAIGASAVKGSKRMGWYGNASRALASRREYGDVGDHSLLTDDEAQKYLDAMGLRLEDGKRLLIDQFKKVNEFAPIVLPADPNFKIRRDRARVHLGLPQKR